MGEPSPWARANQLGFQPMRTMRQQQRAAELIEDFARWWMLQTNDTIKSWAKHGPI